MSRLFILLFYAFVFAMPLTQSALADSVNHRQIKPSYLYRCHFEKYGVVTIDTRHPGTSITIDGVRYPATEGSYFYQSTDGKFAVAFNSKMTVWTYLSADEPKGISDSHCKVIANKR
jgi:hypothetical protein